MSHSFEAVYDHGVFRPVEPVVLPEGTRVHVRVEEKTDAEVLPAKPAEVELSSLLDRLKDVVGSVHDLPEDSSINLDHYLYGRPKR